jgi:SAM-dependent methyltransferase
MMRYERDLPQWFLKSLTDLERAYLMEKDPIRQSGFSGGAERWRDERDPILEAIDEDGEILDIGCANGYLLACLIKWGEEKGVSLVPFGLDQGAGLIKLAKKRFADFVSHFYTGNAWNWEPERRFRYAYTLYDCVPMSYLAEYVRRLLDRVVAPRGRLIIGAYGSRSDQRPPFPIAEYLAERSFVVVGEACGGEPPVSAFAWIDRIKNPLP